METSQIKITRRNILIILISAVLIVVFHNTKIDWYIKDVILPFSIMITSNIYILKNNNYINKKAYYLLIPIALILISDLITQIDYSNMFLNIIILPILITMFFFLLINREYKISSNCLSFLFKLFPQGLFSNLKYLKVKPDDKRSKKVVNIVLGLLFGCAIGFVILILLSSADDYFNAFLGNIFDYFNFDFSNIILLVISFILLFSISINILKNKNTKMREIKYREIDITITITILSIVNLIFVLFLFSELSRLTNNFLKIPLEYTYSSYAREGFFQLLFVTIINFSMIMFILYKTKLIDNSKSIKNLILILISFSIILIANSYYRMFLYVGHYGFTILRLQVILFLAMEIIIFLILVKKIIYGLKINNALLFLNIGCIFYIINLYICNDNFIALLDKLL